MNIESELEELRKQNEELLAGYGNLSLAYVVSRLNRHLNQHKQAEERQAKQFKAINIRLEQTEEALTKSRQAFAKLQSSIGEK